MSVSPARGTVRGQAHRTATVTRTPVSRPPAVASGPFAPVVETPTSVEGVLPRLVGAERPIEMFSPFAAPQYGSARNLVVYTERDNVNTNENASRLQPEGIRFLTVRPIW